MSSVVIVLTESPWPSVGLVEGAPAGELEWRGDVYREQSDAPANPLEPFLGFYDWLRTTTGRLVGFRLLVAEDAAPLLARLPARAYLTIDSALVLDIMFTSTTDAIDEAASTVQDFGASRAFLSDRGQWLFAFDAADLSDAELEQVRSVNS